jgi:hypothetical protein
MLPFFYKNEPVQRVPADRKDAKNVIPDSSACAFAGTGRFTLLPGLPAP